MRIGAVLSGAFEMGQLMILLLDDNAEIVCF